MVRIRLVKKTKAKTEYIGGLFPGALSIIAMPEPSEMPALEQGGLRLQPAAGRCRSHGPRPRARQSDPGQGRRASPIKHCIYIIKENRTYDQVFGDIREGNGDPALCLFPERVTPNLHALARQFVLLDNFYVDGEVSANGHEWSMAAYATDYVEKVWPLVYRHGDEHGKEASPASNIRPKAPRPSPSLPAATSGTAAARRA